MRSGTKIMNQKSNLAYGTGGSVVVDKCQICSNARLAPILFIGYLPPVNKMVSIGTQPFQQPSYPAQLLYCSKCHLVQLGLIVDPNVLSISLNFYAISLNFIVYKKVENSDILEVIFYRLSMYFTLFR